jgi:large subunit ribosomal protein L24
MQKKINIKKGDIVIVITGDDKNQKGRVLSVDRKTNKAIVEGVNMVSRHTKPNSKSPQGGIIKKESPIHISNIMLIDPTKGGATRIGRKINSEGKLVRYSKKSKEEIK